MARKSYEIDDRSDDLLSQMSLITGLDKSVLVNAAIRKTYSGLTLQLDAAAIDNAVKLLSHIISPEFLRALLKEGDARMVHE